MRSETTQPNSDLQNQNGVNGLLPDVVVAPMAKRIRRINSTKAPTVPAAPLASPEPARLTPVAETPADVEEDEDCQELPKAMMAVMFMNAEAELPDAVEPPTTEWGDGLGHDGIFSVQDDLPMEIRRIAVAAHMSLVGLAQEQQESQQELERARASALDAFQQSQQLTRKWRDQISDAADSAKREIDSKGWPGLADGFATRRISLESSARVITTRAASSIPGAIELMISETKIANEIPRDYSLSNMGIFSASGTTVLAIVGAILAGWSGFFLGALIGAGLGFAVAKVVSDMQASAVEKKVARAQGAVQSTMQRVQDFERADRTTMEATIANARARHDARVAEATTRSQEIDRRLRPQVDAYLARVDAIAPAWDDSVWESWQPPAMVQPATRIGVLSMILEGGVPFVPVVVSVPHGLSMLFHDWGADQSHIHENLLMRVLTAFPPGKLEFTLIDPVGLGRNVATLLHLADHKANLVTDRAWVEPRHIEQRLADLSEQMQTIIQKYLKREYASMEEYNTKAGNVEEPYRILVVNNFPANFTAEALRHLVSIVTNGPKCGVYTLIAVDDSQEQPYGFNIADLERATTVVRRPSLGRNEQTNAPTSLGYSIRATGLNPWMFLWENAPSPDLVQRVLETVGQQALVNSVVRVPFADIAPKPDAWWQASSSDGLAAAIGIHGARKKQMLMLGKDTEGSDVLNGVLVVGKVGSGKSTLHHVAIMNLAMTYSPQELELYLIDFKQGVEFKTYAVHQLPHARAIAVESEREFALSVLQRLDKELQLRGELFRQVTAAGGATANIATYRRNTGETLPRILLLIDEFQELFADDDALARTANDILERLVRLGRGYGIHIFLSTQSLAGSSRISTTTQRLTAVRIALMSSDADSRLILSDDNPEARLLNRPGEAIYNNKAGQLEGNNRFQTAWITDEERDASLARLREMARARYPDRPAPIVFEGNRSADVSANRMLTALLASERPAALPSALPAWLGDPIAIAEPTAATFQRQAGSNLLIVGQDDDAALGMLATLVMSLARQHELAADEARIHVVDFTPVDHPHTELLKYVGALFSDRVSVSGRRKVTEVVDAIHAEVEQRMALDDEQIGAPVYLIFAGLQRARDLREAVGNGNGAFDDESSVSPNQQLAKILREGPDLGLHTIAWCDTVGNLDRTLDRRAQQEFEMRVAMQMSAEDSANVVDSAAASKLGPNRALFFREEKGSLEKFRPYGVPGDDLLRAAEQRPRP